MFALLLACVLEAGPVADSAGDTSADSVESVEYVDVVVVGTGASGVAAARTAEANGASVLMFDRAAVPGMGLGFSGQVYGAATSFQAAAGIEDSVEQAIADWEVTTGVSGELPGARTFIEGSAETLDWLATLGFPVSPPQPLPDGAISRLHLMAWSPDADRFGTVMADFGGEVRVGTEVSAPILDDGRVVGVEWTSVETGATGKTFAGSVVLASGGFLRNLEEVAEVRPDLAAYNPLFETNPNSVGSTLPFLDATGAGRERPDQIGAYLHAVQDPRQVNGEALIIQYLPHFILVGSDGKRFADDRILGDFTSKMEPPAGDIWLVTAGESASGLSFSPPSYNWADRAVFESYTVSDVRGWGSTDVVEAESLDALAVSTGLGDALVAEIVTFNELAATDSTDEFGRQTQPDDVLDSPPWLALRLRPSLAKNFGGALTDTDARVLDATGVPIPGLYAAGEVVGMLPGGGSGLGFAGSVGACYDGGRRAGKHAALGD